MSHIKEVLQYRFDELVAMHPNGGNSRYYGVPLEELTKEELIAVANELAAENERARELRIKDNGVLAVLSRAKR